MNGTRLLILVGLCSGYVSTAAAAPISVPFSTTSLPAVQFHGDSFSLSGLSGQLNLDTRLQTSNDVNSAIFDVDYSHGVGFASRILTLTYALTLAGVTHSLSQEATWVISSSVDTFDVLTSSPVRFNTPSGNWNVVLNPFSFRATAIGSQTESVSATFTPVPEPALTLLFFAGGLGLLARRRRDVRLRH
jgi:hypothetical protein